MSVLAVSGVWSPVSSNPTRVALLEGAALTRASSGGGGGGAQVTVQVFDYEDGKPSEVPAPNRATPPRHPSPPPFLSKPVANMSAWSVSSTAARRVWARARAHAAATTAPPAGPRRCWLHPLRV